MEGEWWWETLEAQGAPAASQMLGVSDIGWHGGHRPGKGNALSDFGRKGE